jgi:transposase
MKMSKVAKMIGVDRRTIYNWVANESLKKFFSEGARNEGAREMNEQDIFVVNTINHLKKTFSSDWSDIAEQLESGYLTADLSVSAADVDTGKTPMQLFTRALELSKAHDLAVGQLAEVQNKLLHIETVHKEEIDKARQEYEDKLNEERQGYEEKLNKKEQRYEEKLGKEQQLRIKEIHEASQREGELRYKLGKLEAMLEMLKNQDDSE